MERLLVAVSGAANTGKTTTIKRVYELIEKKYKPTERPLTPPFWGQEIRYIFTIKGIKIGIVSLGDPSNKPRKNLKYFLEYFARKECRIIICACRTKGSTHQAVDHMKQKYRVNWRDKMGIWPKAAQDAANEKMARQIFRELQTQIKR